MEQYLETFPEVTDEMFYKMLKDHTLKNYMSLVNDYHSVKGGIASDLRIYGWCPIADYIAKNRCVKAMYEKYSYRNII